MATDHNICGTSGASKIGTENDKFTTRRRTGCSEIPNNQSTWCKILQF